VGRLSRSAARRYGKEADKIRLEQDSVLQNTSSSGPLDLIREQGGQDQKRARAEEPEQYRPLTRSAYKRYRKEADKIEEAAQKEPERYQPLTRSAARRYSAAAETFGHDPAKRDASSVRAPDFLRGARAVMPSQGDRSWQRAHEGEGSGQHRIYQHRTDMGSRIGRNDSYALPTKTEEGYVDPIKWREEVQKEFAAFREGSMKIIADPHPGYNCHGYTFTDGKGGRLDARDVVSILRENNYKPVSSHQDRNVMVRAGDVIIYRNKNTSTADNIVHSGFISRVEGHNIYVRSKWGEEGVVDHLVADMPAVFGKEWTIYHTERPDGRLLNASN
jgi:hypothetical protein